MSNLILPVVGASLVMVGSVVCLALGNTLEAIYLAVLWVGLTNNINAAVHNV